LQMIEASTDHTLPRHEIVTPMYLEEYLENDTIIESKVSS